MGHEFNRYEEFAVDANVEQVWEAIATGPGIDSWYMGHTQVEHGEGGTVRTTFGGYTPESVVTSWEPLSRFAYRSDDAESGRSIAYEFTLQATEQAGTVLSIVTSGFLPGDDWEREYEAMSGGLDMFFRTLAEYLTYFPGRTATPITAFGPAVPDRDHAWAVLKAELGLDGQVTTGAGVRFTPEGLPPIDGVVYFVNADTLGLRTDDALYRFLRGFHGAMVVGHHLFADEIEPKDVERSWHLWLHRLFGGAE
jgi:uncharacterized protein YndB with AHSA1/START domain